MPIPFYVEVTPLVRVNKYANWCGTSCNGFYFPVRQKNIALNGGIYFLLFSRKLTMDKELLFSKKILTEKECDVIKKFILDNEDYIKSLGPDLYSGTKENSLTGRYKFFNFLNEKKIRKILEPKLREIFDGMGMDYPISVQCWANTFRQGEGISMHKHGPLDKRFFCANLFISGPRKPGTTYYLNNKLVDFENTVGEMYFFDSNLYHGVSNNKSDELRISMAFDILPGKNDPDKIRHYVFHKNTTKGFGA